MPISFTCPHCGTQTNVADQFAGQTGPCSSCGQQITVPGGFAGPPMAHAPKKSSKTALWVVLAIMAGMMMLAAPCLLALLLPAVQAAREAARRSQCSNNLKQIGLAMHNYHDVYKCFPPAVITDEDGVPMRSWRVAILPFMEQQTLYEQWDFNEPWDSPSNSWIGNTGLSAFCCPSSSSVGSTETSYVMVTGKMELNGQKCSTIAGDPNEAATFADITDGSSNTVLVVEIANSGIQWAEPRDLTIGELELLINGPSGTGIGSRHPGGVNVLMADGSVRYLREETEMETLKLILLRDDGNPVFIP